MFLLEGKEKVLGEAGLMFTGYKLKPVYCNPRSRKTH